VASMEEQIGYLVGKVEGIADGQERNYKASQETNLEATRRFDAIDTRLGHVEERQEGIFTVYKTVKTFLLIGLALITLSIGDVPKLIKTIF